MFIFLLANQFSYVLYRADSRSVPPREAIPAQKEYPAGVLYHYTIIGSLYRFPTLALTRSGIEGQQKIFCTLSFRTPSRCRYHTRKQVERSSPVNQEEVSASVMAPFSVSLSVSVSMIRSIFVTDSRYSNVLSIRRLIRIVGSSNAWLRASDDSYP